jgi:hypothetical protein
MAAINPNVSRKALEDFAVRVIMSEPDSLKPGTTVEEIRYFVETQLPEPMLREMYGMFYRTGLVQ